MFACFPIHLLISHAYLSSSGNAFHMLLDFQSPDWNGRVELRYEKESLACLNHMESHPNNIWQHLESWRANSMPQVYLNCLFVCLMRLISVWLGVCSAMAQPTAIPDTTKAAMGAGSVLCSAAPCQGWIELAADPKRLRLFACAFQVVLSFLLWNHWHLHQTVNEGYIPAAVLWMWCLCILCLISCPCLIRFARNW